MVTKFEINEKAKSQHHEQDVLHMKRMCVPDSSQLQNNILNLTQELPQHTDQVTETKIYNRLSFFERFGITKINFWDSVKPFAATLAVGLAVIALSSTLWIPASEDQLSIDSYEMLSVKQLAVEVEWQDLMLLQDELAFASL